MKTLALCFAGLATALLAHADSFPASETFSQSYPVAAQAELSLHNINGSVEIVAWDKNEVSLEAEKRTRTSEDLPKIHIEVNASAQSIEISTHYERTGWGWFGSTVKGAVHYKLMVPASMKLQKIDVVNSNVTIHDVSGTVEAYSVNGTIRATGLSTGARLKTVNGNIEASFASTSTSPEIYAKTVNGSCKIALPEAASADLSASTVNGRVNCEFPIEAVRMSRTKLKGHIGQGKGASIEARSVNGNISVHRQS